MSSPKNLRIGVLTYHNGPNFGGFLQAWHLTHAIRALGFECHAVNYLHPRHHESNHIKISLNSTGALKAKIFWALKKHGFRKLVDSICRHSFTDVASKVPWQDFDIFVIGSDVVWDYQNPSFGHDPVYFGMNEGQDGKKMIAYAASCGPASPDGPFPAYVKEGCRKFTALGLRDPSTARLAKNAAGMESSIVVDPTWLNEDPSVNWPARPKDKYLFVYGGRFSAKLAEPIRDYAQRRGLKIVTALTSFPKPDKKYHSITPFQWVNLFRNAESVVIQGTLHGTVYSLKYGKPFILINGPNTKAKIAGILNRTGQENRAVDIDDFRSQDLELLDEKIQTADELCEDWIRESREFLEQSLKS